MKKSIVGAVAAAIWVANVGITALAAYGLKHPKPYAPGPDVWRPSPDVGSERTRAATQSENAASSIVEIPMVTIVGYRRGAAEMQHETDVVIGPGTVTHPGTDSEVRKGVPR